FKGGLGVVMDDIIAGILTSIIIVIRQLLPLASCFVRYLSFPLSCFLLAVSCFLPLASCFYYITYN
ncbi:MAG: hypothetical protein AB1765_11700, partial [Candidatus Hydrogenedentota bacterium]